MGDYPIYQRQERVQYPDARSMVVNWSRAGEKLAEGVLEGVNLGMKIKKSREESAAAAMNLKIGDEALTASAQKRQIEAARFAQDSQRNSYENDILQMRVNQMQDEIALGIKDIQNDSLLAQAKIDRSLRQAQLNSLNIVADNSEGLRKLAMQTDEVEGKVAQSNNPFEQMNLYDELGSSAQTQAKTKNVSLDDIATSLPAGAPFKNLLTDLTPAGIQAKKSALKIPIIVSDARRTEYISAIQAVNDAKTDGERTAAQLNLDAIMQSMGKQDSTVTADKEVMMPAPQAMTVLSMRGGNQIALLDARYGDDPSYQKWRAKQNFPVETKKETGTPPPTPVGPPQTGTGTLYKEEVIGGETVKREVPEDLTRKLAAGSKYREITKDDPFREYIKMAAATQGQIAQQPKLVEDFMKRALIFNTEKLVEVENQMTKNKDNPKEYIEWRRVRDKLLEDKKQRRESLGIIEENPVKTAATITAPLTSKPASGNVIMYKNGMQRTFTPNEIPEAEKLKWTRTP